MAQLNSSQMTPPARPLLPTSPPLPSLRTGKRIMRPSPAGQGGISPQPRACQPFDYLCHHRVPAPLSAARPAGGRARVPATPKRLRQFWANGARLPAPRAARRGRGPRLGLGLRFGSLPGGCRRPMPVTQGGPAYIIADGFMFGNRSVYSRAEGRSNKSRVVQFLEAIHIIRPEQSW